MAAGRIPTTANSPITAKGDLFTYSTAPARLAVGNDGEQIVADSAATSGLRYQGNYAAGKNAIINGDFKINQRAFTSTTSNGVYGFDRWKLNTSDGTVTYTAQTFTPGAAPVAGYEGANFAQIQTSGATLAGSFSNVLQVIEDVRTFAGQTIAVSFWAKATTGTPKVAVSLYQDMGSGGSGSGNILAGTVTLTTSWARYSVTVAVTSLSGKTIGTSSGLQVLLWTSSGASNAAGQSIGIQNNTIAIWGVQAESGSTATAFQTATGTIQGELDACYRYFQRRINSSATPEETVATAQCVSSTQSYGTLQWFTSMRVAPSVSVSAVTDYQQRNSTAGVLTLTAFTFDRISLRSCRFITTVSTGLTAGDASLVAALYANNATLDASAEL